MIDTGYIIRCDGDEDCLSRIHVNQTAQVVNPNAAREWAAKHGWRSRVIHGGLGRADYCPHHTPAIPEDPGPEALHEVADGEHPWDAHARTMKYRELMVEHGLVVLAEDPFE